MVMAVASARCSRPATALAVSLLGWAASSGSVLAAASAASPAETCECDASASENGDYSSCSLMKLPAGYPANLTIGAWPEPELDLDGLASEKGFTYAEYMRGKGGQPQRALGAKFRNFRRTALEMYWDDGSDPGMYSGQVPALGRTATTVSLRRYHSTRRTHPRTHHLSHHAHRHLCMYGVGGGKGGTRANVPVTHHHP